MVDLRNDLKITASFVEPGSKVLDLGCSDGALLVELRDNKDCVVRGIEKNLDYMHQSLKKGVPVFLGDIYKGLDLYEDDFFDYIILSATIQQLHQPNEIMQKIMSKGKKVIVSFLNYGYYLNRLAFLFKGKRPKNEVFQYDWYDTPDIHSLSIKDFEGYCKTLGLSVLEKTYLKGNWKKPTKFFPNLFSGYAIYLLEKK